jgi:2'-5' RNA ligase
MADPKQKIVQVDDDVVAFPGSMGDEHIATVIKNIRAKKKDLSLTTEKSEHQRQLGNVKTVEPDWDIARQAVYKATEPTLPNPNTTPLAPTLSANKDAAWNAAANAANVGGNVLKRVARFGFGIADILPQTYGIVKNLYSPDEKVSQQAETDLLNLHPGAQISDRLKEAVHDWRKSKSVAVENALGDMIGFYLLDRAGAKLSDAQIKRLKADGVVLPPEYKAGAPEKETAKAGPPTIEGQGKAVPYTRSSLPNKPEIVHVEAAANLKRGVPAVPKPVGKPLSVPEVKALAEQVKGMKPPALPVVPVVAPNATPAAPAQAAPVEPVQTPAVAKEEPKTTKYKYGNTQADIPADSEAGKALASARGQIDKADLMPSTNTTGGGGLEENSHITLRYGIDGEDTEGIKSYLEKQAPFEATLGKTTSFPPSEHSDGGAPIVASIESPELHRMEQEIDAHGNFIDRSFPEYRPHATLGYVRPEAAQKYVGMDGMEGKKFTVNSVSISKKDGSTEEVQLKGEPADKVPIEPARIDKNIQSEPGYAYHATNADRLHEIADSGKLKVNRPDYGTDQNAWPDGSTNKRAYFTANAGSAWQFAPDEGSPVIVRTKSDGLKTENTTRDLYSPKPIPAKSLEYLGKDNQWHPVSDLSAQTPLVQMARTAEGKVKLGADPAALGKILGSSLYKSEGAKVITKELVQNAMDAVRQSTGEKNVTVELFDGTYPPAPKGEVVEHPEKKYYYNKYAIKNPDGSYVMLEDIPPGQTPVVKAWDSDYSAGRDLISMFPQGTNKAIRITDTGKGMTKNELETVFTDLGASGKRDQADASGGFGLAKAAPLMMSKELNVSTVVNEDGKLMRHSFTATPEDLLGNGVDIKSEVLPNGSSPTGTTVTSVLPQEADVWGARNFVTQSNISLRPPGKMKVFQNGEEITPTDQVEMGDKPLASRDVPGAKLDLYTSSKKTEKPVSKYGGFSVEIHNNGIFQFTKHVDVPEGVRGLPARAAIDVRATVPEGHADYPFTANREELRGNDIDGVIRDFVKKQVTDPIVQSHKKLISDMYWNFPYINDSIPVFDSGIRFTPDELQEIISNPAIKSIADNILLLTGEAKNLLEEAGNKDWRMEGYGTKTKRVGIVFSDDVHGVHITNPEDKSHATVFINPFDKEENNPDEYASLIWHTIKHELVHDNVSGHSEDFTTGEKNVARALGKMEIRALTELRNTYADPNDTDRVRPDFDRAFQLYKDSRRREETTPDIFRGEESHSRLAGPTGGQSGEGGIRSGGEGVVSPEQLVEANAEIERLADEHGDHYPYDISEGEQLPRVVWGAKKGQTLKTKTADRVGIKTPNKGVYGLHVGDTDYWKTRLAKDYDQDEGNAQSILIRANDGDRVVDDPQYATDPDTGEKSDAGVLLTARKELQYGKDWVFDGEEFTDDDSTKRSSASGSGVLPQEDGSAVAAGEGRGIPGEPDNGKSGGMAEPHEQEARGGSGTSQATSGSQGSSGMAERPDTSGSKVPVVSTKPEETIKWNGVRPTDEQIDKQYPVLKKGQVVDGRVVRPDVPNQSSIDASSTDPTVLSGIREISMSDFQDAGEKPNPYSVSEKKHIEGLAEEIKNSNEISPLIVMVDKEGPYILEGGHRYDALKILGAKSLPAMVVIDEDAFSAPAVEPQASLKAPETPYDSHIAELNNAIGKANSNYASMSPYEISHGHCYEWAKEVATNLPGAQVKDVDLWPQRGKDNLPYHVWVEYQGKAYDAETPNGVSDWKQLPFFKEHSNQEILPKLKPRVMPVTAPEPPVVRQDVPKPPATLATLKELMAEAVARNPKHVRVKSPDGYTHFFPDQESADRFILEAGLN